jgi:hypothetical protein
MFVFLLFVVDDVVVALVAVVGVLLLLLDTTHAMPSSTYFLLYSIHGPSNGC